MPCRYRIYLLSAKSILSYAKEEGGAVTIALNRDATRRCVVSDRQEQEENALFFQIQCALHGDGFTPTEESGVVEDLSTVLCYVDFSGIFDRNGVSPRVARLQALAEALFRPEGVTLDLGDGPRQYVAFERSNSMSRMGRLSFLRADLWETVRRRIMLDLELGQCQLSKLYAYNGLMLSTGTRVEGIDIDRPHRVIVVDNHALQRSTRVITVEDVGGTDSVRRYQRLERVEDFSVTEFDGEGLVSKEYAARLNKTLGGRHTSFQIRLPFVKGMLHQVDFHDFLRSTDWEQVDANLERLPYLAWQLEEHTPKLREPSQPDEVLFTFAQDPQWKEKLPQASRKLVEEMVLEYQRCLGRIRASMAPVREQPHRTDVERILYARGQEELVTAEELYAAFSALEPEQAAALLEEIREQVWQFLPPGEREDFLREHLPTDLVDEYGGLLCDFRAGGYRILGDLLLDVERENRLETSRQLHRAGDSEQMEEMLESYENKTAQESYREAAARGCRQYLERHIQPKLAVQCAAALGKRGFLWDVLLDAVLATARKEERRD